MIGKEVFEDLERGHNAVRSLMDELPPLDLGLRIVPVMVQPVSVPHLIDHLEESIRIKVLAQMVSLSTSQFCRAFKQSFGIPPHRFHTSRRIERAKALLAKPAPSVTDIGLTVGFSETSSFTAAFRKATGFTPTGYHRSLG